MPGLRLMFWFDAVWDRLYIRLDGLLILVRGFGIGTAKWLEHTTGPQHLFDTVYFITKPVKAL